MWLPKDDYSVRHDPRVFLAFHQRDSVEDTENVAQFWRRVVLDHDDEVFYLIDYPAGQRLDYPVNYLLELNSSQSRRIVPDTGDRLDLVPSVTWHTGRLAQSGRALASHARGHWFKSSTAHYGRGAYRGARTSLILSAMDPEEVQNRFVDAPDLDPLRDTSTRPSMAGRVLRRLAQLRLSRTTVTLLLALLIIATLFVGYLAFR